MSGARKTRGSRSADSLPLGGVSSVRLLSVGEGPRVPRGARCAHPRVVPEPGEGKLPLQPPVEAAKGPLSAFQLHLARGACHRAPPPDPLLLLLGLVIRLGVKIPDLLLAEPCRAIPIWALPMTRASST